MKRKQQMQKRKDIKTVLGSSIGAGHTPAALIPEIRLVDMGPAMLSLILAGNLQPGTKVYRMGDCQIICSPPYEQAGVGYHLSISHPSRYPTWDEIAKARYTLLPDEINYVMHLPKVAEYINLHRFCFQIHEDDAARRSPKTTNALELASLASSGENSEIRHAALRAIMSIVNEEAEKLLAESNVIESLDAPIELSEGEFLLETGKLYRIDNQNFSVDVSGHYHISSNLERTLILKVMIDERDT